MKLSERSKIIKSKNAYVQDLEGEAVILDMGNNQYYRLDEDSRRMFAVLTSAPTLGEAHKILTAEYEVAADELWEDLAQYVEELANSGLVQVLDE